MSAQRTRFMSPASASPCPRTVLIQDAAATCPCPRTVPVHVQSAPTDTSANSPRPRSRCGLNCPRTGNSHGREPVTDRPRSRPVRARDHAVSAHCPQNSTGQRMFDEFPHRVHSLAGQITNSHPNHYGLCPHLIPTPSAKRSRSLRRAGHRNSRTCSQRKMLSLSCGKSARPTGRLLTC